MGHGPGQMITSHPRIPIIGPLLVGVLVIIIGVGLYATNTSTLINQVLVCIIGVAITTPTVFHYAKKRGTIKNESPKLEGSSILEGVKAKLPNPLSKKEMKAASDSDKSDIVDRMQGVWPQINVLSLILALIVFAVCITVVLFYYMRYTSLYYWLAFPVIVVIVLIADRLYINHFAPESPLFTQCRRKNLPLGRIHWGNGMETWEPLYKDRKGSLFFKRFGKIFGLDMTLYNEARSSFCRGIEIIDYFTDSLLPFGGMHAASAFQTADYLRDSANGFPRLAGMSLHSMMVLVNKPLSKLSNDVYKYVHVERKEDTSEEDHNKTVAKEARELLDEVKKAQEAIRELPVLHGVFNWNVISQIENTQLDVKWAEDMQSEIRKETMNEEEAEKRHGRWVVWAIGMIIAGGVAGLLILSQL